MNREQKKSRKKTVLLIVIIAASLLIAGVVSCVIMINVCKYREKARIESGYRDGVNPVNLYAEDVTMIQLIATPEKYDGKLVRVIGVGNLEFEGNYLSLDMENYKHQLGNDIWLELGSRATSYEEAQAYNGKYVIVEGFFHMNEKGHFSMFHGTIKDVSRYEPWTVYFDETSLESE
jgi:hypothetical protein